MVTDTNILRPFTAWLLIILLILIGIGALTSGPMLFAAPDGHLMQWTVDDLYGTPFSDYLIPGIILFVFMGIFPVFVAIGLIKKADWRFPEAINICKSYNWSWTGAWAAGVIMLIWIAAETALLGYISFLQPVAAGWGIVLVALALLPGVRRYYHRPYTIIID